ncbi:MAG: hypothetical protein HQ559_16650, partial [Lentisphaerae bacterium]|nr:hypothetical protein [Lentisphaerota bacterium]
YQSCSNAGEAAKAVRPREMGAHYSSMGFRCLRHSSERTARTLAAWLVADLIRKVLLAPQPVSDASLRTLEDWSASFQEGLSRMAGKACSEVSNALFPPGLTQLCERLSDAVLIDPDKKEPDGPNVWDDIRETLYSSREITNTEVAAAVNQLGEDVTRRVYSALDNSPNSYGWVLLILEYLLGKRPDAPWLARFLDDADLDPARAPVVAVTVTLYAHAVPIVRTWLDRILKGARSTQGLSHPKDDLWANPGALDAALGQLEEKAGEAVEGVGRGDLRQRCCPSELRLARALIRGLCQWPPPDGNELDDAVGVLIKELEEIHDEFAHESTQLRDRLTAIDEERKRSQKFPNRILHFFATSKTLRTLDKEETAIEDRQRAIAVVQKQLGAEHLAPALQTAHACQFVLAPLREAAERLWNLRSMVKETVDALDAAAREAEHIAGHREVRAGLCPEFMDEPTLRALYQAECPSLQEVLKNWQDFPKKELGQKDVYEGLKELSEFLGPKIPIAIAKLKAYARHCYRHLGVATIADMLERLTEDVRQRKLLALFKAARPRPPFNLDIDLNPYEIIQLAFPAVFGGEDSPVAADLRNLWHVSEILDERDPQRIVLHRYELGVPAFLLPQLRAMRRVYRNLRRNGAVPMDAPPGVELLPEYLLCDDFLEAVTEYLPDLAGACLQKAHGLAGARHRGKRRPNGAPWLEHDEQIALSVAEQLRDREEAWWRGCPLAPEQVVAAPLIHQVAATTDLSQDIVAREFDAPLAEAVKALSQESSSDTTARLQQLVQDCHGALLLVALCEQLQNLLSLDPEDAETVDRCVRETTEHYLPLAREHEPELAKRLEQAAGALAAPLEEGT